MNSPVFFKGKRTHLIMELNLVMFDICKQFCVPQLTFQMPMSLEWNTLPMKSDAGFSGSVKKSILLGSASCDMLFVVSVQMKKNSRMNRT